MVQPGLDAASSALRVAERLNELTATRAAGADAVAAAAKRRFEALVRHAQQHSRFYRDAWRSLRLDRAHSHRLPSLQEFPVVGRGGLMGRFDDWVTDRGIRLDDVEAFVNDTSRIGQRFRERYCIWTSSGTRGEPGIFVSDDEALCVYDALVAAQLGNPALAMGCMAGMLAGGGRSVLIAATGDHYASIASWRNALRNAPWLPTAEIPVTAPLPDIVEALNRFQPAFVASYPTMLLALASERASGRLRIAPTTLWSGGERLTEAMKATIESAFCARVQQEYGASEALSIAFGCDGGWLHVNADWMIVEPVDRRGHAVPPGTLSDRVLLTNLANFVQPIIRYDLGDRVMMKDGPCECGSSLPAIRVEGRTDDLLHLELADGRRATLAPMAIATAIEEATGLHRFQVVKTAPDRLAVRLPCDGLERRLAWSRLYVALQGFLSENDLLGVEVTLDDREPAISPESGKLQAIVDEA